MNGQDNVQMKAAMLMVEAVSKANELGLVLDCNGTCVSVHLLTNSTTIPLVNEGLANSLFESESIQSIIDWLEGMLYGRATS